MKMNDYNGKYTGTPSNGHFKKPGAKRKLKTELGSVKKCRSSSEESLCSNPESVASSNGSDLNALSIVAQFDDFMRMIRNRGYSVNEDILLDLAEHIQIMNKNWEIAFNECQRLRLVLDKQTHDLSDLESKLTLARKLLDQEKKVTKNVLNERDLYLSQLMKLRTILTKDCWNKIPKEALDNLNVPGMKRMSEHNIGITSPPLDIIPEGNTTGSLLSDLSYSMSEDDFDGTAKGVKNWNKYRPSLDGAHGEPATKKRRSSGNHAVEIKNTETVRATTTLTLNKKGPITATSVIESVPQEEVNNKPQQPPNPKKNLFNIDANRNVKLSSGHRQHCFQTKTIVMPDKCGYCDKRIGFAKTVAKCKTCRSVCHPECKDNLPLPCVPCANTPTHNFAQGNIGDYTPTIAPMVPAIIVHCLKEIEAKGLKELGIYRIPGAERDVKALKERFLKGKAPPPLHQVDIHVICGAVKDFLRFLNEPLVTRALWSEFVKTVECQDEKDIAPNLCQIVSELPQPNRDTLAYIILHLKKVAESKECKMPLTNLARVFGPTIVGYSSKDLDPADLMTETRQQVAVMEKLLELPTEYWQEFIQVPQLPIIKLQQTPSTDSLLRPTPTRIFSSRFERDYKKKKILSTPSSLLT